MIFAGVAREPAVPRPYQPEPHYPGYAGRSAQPQSAPQARDDDSTPQQLASAAAAESAGPQTESAFAAPAAQRAPRRPQVPLPASTTPG